MSNVLDVKPIFDWAIANGEAKIVDRILVKLMPQMIAHGCQLTSATIEENSVIEVPQVLFEQILNTAQEFVGISYTK